MADPIWVDTEDCLPPHRVARPEQVIDLAEQFARFGWDTTKPALVGYFSAFVHISGPRSLFSPKATWDITKPIQLLTGSHRYAAAVMAKIKIPVVLLLEDVVRNAWGDLQEWDYLMKMGDTQYVGP